MWGSRDEEKGPSPVAPFAFGSTVLVVAFAALLPRSLSRVMTDHRPFRSAPRPSRGPRRRAAGCAARRRRGAQLDGTIDDPPPYIPRWSDQLCGDGKHCPNTTTA